MSARLSRRIIRGRNESLKFNVEIEIRSSARFRQNDTSMDRRRPTDPHAIKYGVLVQNRVSVS